MNSQRAIVPDALTLSGPHGPLPVRVYRPAEPAGVGLVWLHGGAFFGGNLDMPEAEWVSGQLAARGITVVSVDYRLAPIPAGWTPSPGTEPRGISAAGAPGNDGARFPVASEEAAVAFRWAAGGGTAGALPDAAPAAWAIGGASAGGNIATGAALRLGRERAASGTGVPGTPVPDAAPVLVVLAYPTLHAVQPEPSAELASTLEAARAAGNGGALDAARTLQMYRNYAGPALEDPLAVPGLAGPAELADFPPTIMGNSEADFLRASGEGFAATLRAAGREVESFTEPGTWHGHLNDPGAPAALATLERFAARLLTLA